MRFNNLEKLAMALAVLALPACAATVYNYTGNNYMFVCTVLGTGGSGGSCNGTPLYTTSESISGQVTLVNPLAPNLADANVTDLSAYSFNDGMGDIWNSGDSTVNTFQAGTNSQGAITNWELLLISSGGPFNGIVLVTCGGTGLTITQCSPDPEDFADVIVGTDGFSYGTNTNDPGTWSSQAQATPEPGGFALLGGTLVFAAVLRRLWAWNRNSR